MWKNELVPTSCVILHGNNHSQRSANATNRVCNADFRETISKRVRIERIFWAISTRIWMANHHHFCKNRAASDKRATKLNR